MTPPRVYKDLKPKHRYQSDHCWLTLMKKGYHPKTGLHKPTVSVAEHNEYLLEQALVSGKLELDGWSYPVISWKFVSRTAYDNFDTVRAVYELELGVDGLPVKKYRYSIDDEKNYGLGATRVGHNVRVGEILACLLKKSVLFDGVNHEVMISVPYYHMDMVCYELKSGVMNFNHMLYLVLRWEEIEKKTALKKDGTPYFSRNRNILIRFKAPGRRMQYERERRKSVIDEMLEHV